MSHVISLEALRDGMVNEPCSDFDVEEIVARKTLQEQVRKAVAALPENKRQVVEMRYFEDMAISAIAKALDISSSAVKRLEKAALADLKVALIQYA
jgi:RNA polymerase sigma factor (sigma-70 family)